MASAYPGTPSAEISEYIADYTGVNVGLVVFIVGDPGMHSLQNEQDTRMIARAANIPLMKPSDSMEYKAFVRKDMKISENYDTPVIIRLTTRVAHSKVL